MEPILYCAKNKEIYGSVLYQNFSMSFCIRIPQHVDHKDVTSGSHLDCSVGQQV